MNENNTEGPQSLETLNLTAEVQTDHGDKKKQKIDILLKPTGNAPIMKQKKWAVDAEKTISGTAKFIREYLKLKPQERIFLYVNQTFAPSPDQILRNLFDCYSTEGRLVLHYCISQAWG